MAHYMEETTNVVKQIRKATRRKFSAEEGIRIVPEGLPGDIPVSEFCSRYGIQNSVCYKRSKAFLDAGKTGEDRIEKAVDLLNQGEVDYLIFTFFDLRLNSYL